jgi:hypothetical protein
LDFTSSAVFFWVGFAFFSSALGEGGASFWPFGVSLGFFSSFLACALCFYEPFSCSCEGFSGEVSLFFGAADPF